MVDIKQTQLFISLFRGRTDDYARYALKDGAMEEKRQLIQLFNTQLYIRDKTVISKG